MLGWGFAGYCRDKGAYRFTSSSSSWSVALFFSFCGFGFLTAGGGSVSSYSSHQMVPMNAHKWISYPAEPIGEFWLIGKIVYQLLLDCTCYKNQFAPV